MNELALKWIIEDGEIVMGKVVYHEQLCTTGDKQKILGGGRWIIDDNGDIYFYGRSFMFPHACTKEEVIKALEKSIERESIFIDQITDRKIWFSESEWLSEVINNKELIWDGGRKCA